MARYAEGVGDSAANRWPGSQEEKQAIRRSVAASPVSARCGVGSPMRPATAASGVSHEGRCPPRRPSQSARSAHRAPALGNLALGNYQGREAHEGPLPGCTAEREGNEHGPKDMERLCQRGGRRQERRTAIGFCLLNSGYGAFDIDDCRDPASGAIDPWAEKLVARAGSYAEVTVLGTGLRIIGRATGSKIHRKQAVTDGVTLETYRGAERYIVMTGDDFAGVSSGACRSRRDHGRGRRRARHRREA